MSEANASLVATGSVTTETNTDQDSAKETSNGSQNGNLAPSSSDNAASTRNGSQDTERKASDVTSDSAISAGSESVLKVAANGSGNAADSNDGRDNTPIISHKPGISDGSETCGTSVAAVGESEPDSSNAAAANGSSSNSDGAGGISVDAEYEVSKISSANASGSDGLKADDSDVPMAAACGSEIADPAVASHNGAGVNGSNQVPDDPEYKIVALYLRNYLEEEDSEWMEISEKESSEDSAKGSEEDSADNFEHLEAVSDTLTSRMIEEGFENIEVSPEVSYEILEDLMTRAVNHHYQAHDYDNVDADINVKCSKLIKLDYICKDLMNSGGTLCNNYPQCISIPIAERIGETDTADESTMVPGFAENFEEYAKLAGRASLARCRRRFPVPVILYKSNFICRSGTVAVRKGAVFEASRKASKPEGEVVGSTLQSVISTAKEYASTFISNAFEAGSILLGGVEEMKNLDVKILEILRIRYISDLMVENRKVHTGMTVSSSEKCNRVKYGHFVSMTIPYPGCEFFEQYSRICRSPEYKEELKTIKFNWQASEIDSSWAILPASAVSMSILTVQWSQYKEWNIERLTLSYLSLLLHYMEDEGNSLLVHCISGWDRTPLFISLTRITLWAVGLIHKNLNVNQMAYLTLGYDWYLFGHNLPNRIKKREEIMHFCFKVLPDVSNVLIPLMSHLDGEEVETSQTRMIEISDLLLVLYQAKVDPLILPVADSPE